MTQHLIAILVALDALTTYVILRKGGFERNAVLAAILKRAGVVPGLLVTHAALIAAVYLWGALLPVWVLLALALAFAGLAVNNLLVIRKL